MRTVKCCACALCGWKCPYQFCCQKITKNWQKTGSDDFEKSQLFFTKVLSWRGWRTIISDLSMCVSSRECWRVKIVLSLMWGKFWNTVFFSTPQVENLKDWCVIVLSAPLAKKKTRVAIVLRGLYSFWARRRRKFWRIVIVLSTP